MPVFHLTTPRLLEAKADEYAIVSAATCCLTVETRAWVVVVQAASFRCRVAGLSLL